MLWFIAALVGAIAGLHTVTWVKCALVSAHVR